MHPLITDTQIDFFSAYRGSRCGSVPFLRWTHCEVLTLMDNENTVKLTFSDGGQSPTMLTLDRVTFQ